MIINLLYECNNSRMIFNYFNFYTDIVNVNPKCYKMVILVDDVLPWSPMSIITQEADIKAKTKLRIKMNCKLDRDNVVNMFEVPINSVSFMYLYSASVISSGNR